MRNNFYYGLAFIVMAFLLLFGGTAHARDKGEAKNLVGYGIYQAEQKTHHWYDDFHNSTLTGYIIDGASKSIIENVTIYTPEDEKFLGIPLTFARYRIVFFDGKDMVDDLLLVGKIGQKSDTFYVSYRKIDEPFDMNTGGVLYNVTQHWDESLPPVLLGLYIMDDGNFMYSLLGEYEIATGYYIGADVIMGMEDLGNRDFVDFKVWGKHNFEPDGTVFGEVFVHNIFDKTYYGGGIGFTF